MKKQFILFVALSCLWLRGDARSKYVTDEEDNPYEFGFTIDGQQHRHEKKDANGIIQGEFGFITADGIYHVTVYATDENGNFRILSMRNVRVSGPLDEPNASLPDTSQFSKGQPAAPNPLSINTTPAPVQTVQPVTQSNRFTTQSTIKPACAGCGYVTHATPLNKPENNLPFQTQAGYNPKPQDVIIGDKRPNVQQQSLGQSGVQHGVQQGVQQGVTPGSGLGIPTSTKAPFVSKPIGGKPQTGSGFHSVGQFNPPGNSPNYPNQGIQASLTTPQNLGNQPQLSPGLGPNTGHSPSYLNPGNQDLVVAAIPTNDNGLQNQPFSGPGLNAVGQFNRPGNNVYPNQGNKEPSVNPQTHDLNLHKAQTDIPQTSQTPVDSQKTLIDRKSIEGQHLLYNPILGQIPTGDSNQGTPTSKNYPLSQNPLETTTKNVLSYQQSVTIQPGTYQNQEQSIQHGSIPKQNSEIFPQSNSHISPNSPDSEKHRNYQNIPISDNQEQLNQNRQDAQNLRQSLNPFLSDPIKSQVGSQSTIPKQTPEVFTETSSYTSPKSFFSNKTPTSQNILFSNDQEQLNQNRPSYKQQDAPSLEQVSNPLSSKPVNPQVGPHGTLSPQSVPNLLHRPDGQINETPHQYQPIPTYVVPEQPQIYQNFEQSPFSNPTVIPDQHLVITLNSDAPQSKPQTPQNNIPQHQNNFNTEQVTRPPTQSRQQTPQEQRTESPQNKQQDTGSVAPFTSEIQKPQISGSHHQPNQQQDPLLNPLSISSPNHLSSLAPQSGITVSNGVINVPNNPPIPIQDKYPGMVDGLPAGIKEGDITDLLYRFNYTVGFHGHYEKGYKNGAKVGGYFVNDRDGVSRIVTYVADENGYRPKVKFIRLDLNSDLVPKEGTEKTFGLKNFEFVWYPLN